MDAYERAAKRLQAGSYSEAVNICRRILRFAPDHSETWNILGLAQLALGAIDEAAFSFERADSAESFNNLGSLRKQQGRMEEAVAAYQRAIARDSNYADAHFNLGTIYRDQNSLSRAAESFQKAAAANPADNEAWYSAGMALFSLGHIAEAMDDFRQAVGENKLDLPVSTIATIIPGDPRADHQAVLDARRAYAKFLPRPRPAKRHQRNHPLRIGYVSSFFHRHNWMKPVWALINCHDRERVQIHLFSDAPASAIDHGYRAHPSDSFHDITNLSNDAAADLIQQSEIDILIDLNGYSKIHRLGILALKPAPVVAGWFNMYATTGIAAYDYLIGDDAVILADEEPFYSEKIIRVPGSYLTFQVDYAVPDVAPAPWIKNGFVTFGSLASQYKIAPHVQKAWMTILRRLPTSRMILKNAALGPPENAQAVRDTFEDVADRVRIEGPCDHYTFLEAYDQIDIALDTFPYNGGTTTTEAIWQGVPVLTFAGDRWASRTSASILRAANLGDFVMANVDDYVAKAVKLASSPDQIRRVSREQIRESAACDARAFAQNMEAIYERISEVAR